MDRATFWHDAARDRDARRLRRPGPEPVRGCARGQRRKIESSLSGRGRLIDARAVRSRDYEDVWFIAAKMEGPDVDAPDSIATWASVYDRESLVSVNDAADKYADLAPAITMPTNPQLSMDRDGAELSQDCVRESAR